MPDPDKFDQWAILELFGRQRFAGRVSEALIAGAPFIRLDVPELLDEAGQVSHAAYTRFFGAAAVYAISPVSEAVARSVAIMCHPQPVQQWELTVPDSRAVGLPADGAPHWGGYIGPVGAEGSMEI